MKFIKTPMKGMPEQLPNVMEIREYAQNIIKSTYSNYGFSLIETPAIEHIENLTNKQGGENEHLIFRILKRGEKLENATNVEDMCDSGLRYDLTVPLSRFYANNINVLPMPFKALQIGNVFRADRPQKGRFRQFTQCDIDILGDESNLAEIELICATGDCISKLNVGNFKIRVNDRRILKQMALACNFDEDKLNDVYIALDKMDKIGLDGVKGCLVELGLNEQDVETYCNLFTNYTQSNECKTFLTEKLEGKIDEDIVENLNNIITTSSKILNGKGSVVFDPTLVRGMSYYTGPIFEIELENYHLSCGGGGRYDEMIGKYCGQKVCACGFSIGFERIVDLLKDSNFKVPSKPATAFLINKDVSYDKIEKVIAKANQMRQNGEKVMVSPRNKNAKFQKETLTNLGYDKFIDIYNDTDI